MFYYLICFVVIALGSTVLHELAHGLVAYWLGDDTAKLSGRLTLNPLKHIDPIMSIVLPLFFALMGMPILGGAKPVPINTHRLRGGDWGFAAVAIAGPLTNFILSFVFFLIGYATSGTVNINAWGIIPTLGLYLNLGYMLFNIIPIPPLDGSRVLRAFAPDFVRNFMDNAERFGLMVIYVLLLVGGGLLSSYFYWAENGILSFFIGLVS